LPQGSQISETSNTSVNITANANTWAFGVDGKLTLPDIATIIAPWTDDLTLTAQVEYNICTIQNAGSGYSGGTPLPTTTTGGTGSGMTVNFGYGISGQLVSVSVSNPGTGYSNGDVIGVDGGTGTFVITKYNISANQANNNTLPTDWTFGTDGNLTLPTVGSLVGNLIVPGSIVSSGASPAPYISGFSSISALTLSAPTLTNGNSNVTVNVNSNLWNFDSTGNLTIPGSSGGFIKTVANASIGIAAVDNGTNNPAQLLSMTNAGAATSIISAYATNATIQTNATGTLKTWSFDNAGNLTLPGNTFAVNYANGTQVPVGVTQDITSNGAMSIMLYDGNIKYNNYATVEPSTGNIAGGNISASGNISANNFTGNGGSLSNVATKISSSWTLASGNNTVSISVPLNGTYALWVNGNIPNGIITYTATAVVTNTNVPVLGEQYGWYYAVGNALVFTSIPDQFVGTVGSISNVNTYVGNTANVFTFGITNNSGNTAVVNYGYTKL
jgi:hypothetical protein